MCRARRELSGEVSSALAASMNRFVNQHVNMYVNYSECKSLISILCVALPEYIYNLLGYSEDKGRVYMQDEFGKVRYGFKWTTFSINLFDLHSLTLQTYKFCFLHVITVYGTPTAI